MGLNTARAGPLVELGLMTATEVCGFNLTTGGLFTGGLISLFLIGYETSANFGCELIGICSCLVGYACKVCVKI